MTGIVSGLGPMEASKIVLLLNNADSGTGSEAMAGLEIIVKELEEASQTDIRQVGIQSNGEYLTRISRVANGHEDTFLHAPPSHLAYWILDNWWRTFHETQPAGAVTAGWLLAHNMSSIGGGYASPPVRIGSEGNQVGIRVQPQRADSLGPVRFVADHYRLTRLTDVERTFDEFLEHTCEFSMDQHDTLLDLHQQVMREGKDPEFAIWRSIEAELGSDVDEAPVELMNQLNEFIEKFGQDVISEACISKQGTNTKPNCREQFGQSAASEFVTPFHLRCMESPAEAHL